MSTFFSFGNVAIDDLVFADGTTQWNVPGGGAAYSALGMAIWAGTATVVAPAGPEFPRAELAHLVFACTRELRQTMRNWGLYEDDGSRHFVPRRASEDWESLSPGTGDLGAGPYAHCHLAPLPWQRANDLVDALRARGARVISLDVHDRKLAAITLEQYIALAQRVDVFMPSLQDANEYFPDVAAVDALRALRRLLPDVAVLGVKRGSEGVIVHRAGSDAIVSVPPVEAQVIDATGAGDAFCGGFLVGYAGGNDAVDGALYGSVSASYAFAATSFAGLLGAGITEARERLATLRARVTRMPLAT